MEVVYIEKQTKQKKYILFILFFIRLSVTNKFPAPPLLTLRKQSWSRHGQKLVGLLRPGKEWTHQC